MDRLIPLSELLRRAPSNSNQTSELRIGSHPYEAASKTAEPSQAVGSKTRQIRQAIDPFIGTSSAVRVLQIRRAKSSRLRARFDSGETTGKESWPSVVTKTVVVPMRHLLIQLRRAV